ncbi:hypothetical protein ARTSIC4J27_1654 [Pseudarthrobacter siccitolerans]|uniref:Uncharacterized protein n=1 Tax=Pseudarthrobacter siccitolerans TaxID=861266 RepID=A0A024H0I1_9MICC|nr:hypothetical protein ARTSIC4J27_1654 [Pseudarthrobacter siccitolerans]
MVTLYFLLGISFLAGHFPDTGKTPSPFAAGGDGVFCA